MRQRVPFRLRLHLARLRVLFRRRRLVTAVLVAMAGALAALTIVGEWTAANEAKTRWGETVEVVVVVSPVERSEDLAGAIEIQTVPRAVVPVDALAAVSTDSFARHELRPGDIVRERDVARPGSSALRDGERSLMISRDDAVPAVETGDTIDLLILGDPGFADPFGSSAGELDDAGDVVASRVIAVGDEAIAVAVAQGEALRVARAIASGTVMVAVS